MLKNRTIEELHDKYVGHRKFAKVCDLLIKKGYSVTEIKEYNEQFKFKVNDYDFTYRKEWKGVLPKRRKEKSFWRGQSIP